MAVWPDDYLTSNVGGTVYWFGAKVLYWGSDGELATAYVPFGNPGGVGALWGDETPGRIEQEKQFRAMVERGYVDVDGGVVAIVQASKASAYSYATWTTWTDES